MAKAGNVTVEIIGKDKASPAMKSATRSTKDLTKATGGLGGGFKKMAIAARSFLPMLTGAAIIGGLTKMITLTAQAGDKFAKMSQKLGISVETLSTFDHVAKISGITIDVVAVGMRRFAQNAVDMSRGIGEAKREFELMNISVADSEGKMREMEDLLLEVADRFSQMEDGTLKTATAMRLFGRSGAEMIPMLNQGRAGIQLIMEEARELGLVFDKESAQAMEQFNDNMQRLKGQMKGFAFFVGEKVIPVMSKMLEMFGYAAKLPLVESIQKSISLIKPEIDSLTKSIEKQEAEIAKWGEQYPAAMAIQIKKDQKVLAELVAELKHYENRLVEATQKEKEYAESKTKLLDATEKLKTKGIDKNKGAIAALQKEYDSLFLTERQQLEQWQLEQLALKGVNEEMVNAIYQRKLVALVTGEIVERNRQAAEATKELAEATREFRVEQEGILTLGPPMLGYTEEDIDSLRRFKGEIGLIEGSVNHLSESFSSGLAQAVAGMIVSGKKFGEVMKGVFRMLVGEVARYIVKLLLAKAIKTLISPLGGFFHEGGMVAHQGKMIMHGGGMVPWKKAHRGLAPDERPIIAQTGEAILSRRGVATIGGPIGVEAINRGKGGSPMNVEISMTNSFGDFNSITDVEGVVEILGQKLMTTVREAA